jgi:hypothetical protein
VDVWYARQLKNDASSHDTHVIVRRRLLRTQTTRVWVGWTEAQDRRYASDLVSSICACCPAAFHPFVYAGFLVF